MLRGLPKPADENLLVGTETADDAGVYRLAPDLALVQTVDFFPPVVDDPFAYGQIAAANALSDVYAMGGVPKTVLNLAAFPDQHLSLDLLNRILAGGADRVAAAGAVVVGGHTIRDEEIKFGLAVTGLVHPDRIWMNAGARPGDELILTKALGTGFITTANKKEQCPPESLQAALDSMIQLNRSAAEIASRFTVHGCTDITGYGLAGHAFEMAEGSNVTLELFLNTLPLLPGVLDLVRKRFFTRASQSNYDFVKERLAGEGCVDEALEEVIYDAQTSGGLLLSVPADQAPSLLAELRAACPVAARIGRVLPPGPARLRLRADP